jgi:hypothetical protein
MNILEILSLTNSFYEGVYFLFFNNSEFLGSK